METVINAVPYLSFKDVPDQNSHSSLTIESTDNIKVQGSAYREVGAPVAGYTRVVPPIHNQDAIVNALQVRQLAEPLPLDHNYEV